MCNSAGIKRPVSVAQFVLNQGLVGLGILDKFFVGMPILTINCGLHSREISYRENGVNGVMTADNLDAYVEAGVHVLLDAQELDMLRAGCALAAREYTVECMAQRFADGISRCLGTPRYSRLGRG